jgi:two-component system chemotaxis response regulator CheY
MKILLIDDSRTMRNIEKKALAELGAVEFAEAGDGVEALAAVAKEPGGFQIILSDWNMPNMDGLTFTKTFRQQNKSTPLVMVTTEGEKSRIIEAIRAGANNYVVKPFTGEVLLDRVRKTLEALSPAPLK